MKETTEKSNAQKKRSAKKWIKRIVILLLLAVIVLAGIKYLPQPMAKKTTVSTRIVSYNVTEVTKGSVTQTISGSGNLTPVTKKTVTASFGGEVDAVYYSVGDYVKKNAVIAKVDGTKIKASCAGIILDLPIEVGDELSRNGTVATIMSKEGFTMNINVDETEISSVKLGQAVSFSIDAVSGDYTGEVSRISYSGSSSGGSVVFQITAKIDYIEGVYPGMSASAQIVIEDSGEGLMVPVEAVSTSGDTKYVYAAPADAEKGGVYSEEELDLNTLTIIPVETGMSDGSYILVTSDELSENSLIIVTKITSTATGSEQSGSESGFEGMNFPGGFNMEDFDPSQMNFPGGSGGGSMNFPGGGSGRFPGGGGGGGFSGFGH